MSKITAIILAVFSVVLIFIGVVRQVNYSDRYVQTKAVLVDSEKSYLVRSSITKYTFNYFVDGKKYTATLSGGFDFDERNIGYKKTDPSEYKFGRIEHAAKIAFFAGIAFALFAVWVLWGFVLNKSHYDKIFFFIILYSTAGVIYISERVHITVFIVPLIFAVFCFVAAMITGNVKFLELFQKIMLLKESSSQESDNQVEDYE